jgi:uncharacterized protein
MKQTNYLKLFIALTLSLHTMISYAQGSVEETESVKTVNTPAEPEITMDEIYQILLENPPNFETTNITLGNKTISVDIADNIIRQTFGLMGRKSLPKDTGMLFVFKKAIPICFWMKHTHMPLSIGFFDENGVLINHENMEPLSEKQHCSNNPTKYVLEINKNWFEDNNIAPGEQLTTESE